jgi:dihydroflavonol-4-reductase
MRTQADMRHVRDTSPAGRPPVSVVTGGAGFIGQHLVRLLLERGHDVRVVDLRDAPGLDGRARLVRGSILDAGLVRAALGGADYVFHLAANPDLWAPDKRTFTETNHRGTCIVLAEAERARPRRVVHCSTESILKGVRRGGRALADETLARSADDMPGPYCRSKFLAEREAVAAAGRGLPVVIVNPTLPVGPGDVRITPPTRMLLDFLNGAHAAYLDFEMNLVDVRDAALGHLLAAERGRVGERYILGGENVRLSRVLGLLSELTGLRMPRARVPYPLALAAAAISEFVADHVTHRPPRAPLTGVRLARSSMVFDCTRARRELGLSPRAIRQSLAEAVAWLHGEGRIRRPLPRVPLAGWPRSPSPERSDPERPRDVAGVGR